MAHAYCLQFVAGYVYGDSTSGTRAVYEIGFTGKPIYNVNSNCSTGSSALMVAQQVCTADFRNVYLESGR